MNYVFLGGSGRSGTSFVQKLLILHSEIHGGPEFDFLPRFMQVFSQMKQPQQLQRQAFFYDENSAPVGCKMKSNEINSAVLVG